MKNDDNLFLKDSIFSPNSTKGVLYEDNLGNLSSYYEDNKENDCIIISKESTLSKSS